MIVCNATPLIAFARIQRLYVLREVVAELVIPDEVSKEISKHRNRLFGGISLEQEAWISVQRAGAVVSSGAAAPASA